MLGQCHCEAHAAGRWQHCVGRSLVRRLLPHSNSPLQPVPGLLGPFVTAHESGLFEFGLLVEIYCAHSIRMQVFV